MGASGRPFQLRTMQTLEAQTRSGPRGRVARKKNRAAGFTVLELVATIVIVGVLAATAAPIFFNNQPFQERGYADEIASALRYARRVAVASECRVAVSISPAGYAVNQHTDPDTCRAGTNWNSPVRRPDGQPLTGATPADVTVTPSVVVIFNVDGSLAAAPPTVAIGTFTLTWDVNGGSAKVWP